MWGRPLSLPVVLCGPLPLLHCCVSQIIVALAPYWKIVYVSTLGEPSMAELFGVGWQKQHCARPLALAAAAAAMRNRVEQSKRGN